MRMSRIAGLIIPKAPSTFTVTLRPSSNGYMGSSMYFYIGYSLDGGTTWTDLHDFVTSDIVLSNVDEIMFRAVCGDGSYASTLTGVGTTDGGNEIVQGVEYSTVYSNNITITMNTMYYIQRRY